MPTTNHSAVIAPDLHVQGPMAYHAISSGPYTLLQTDTLLVVDCTGGAVTVNLPLANTMPIGQVFMVWKDDSSANLVTVNRAGSDTINGATSRTLGTQYQWMTLVGDGVSVWRAFF